MSIIKKPTAECYFVDGPPKLTFKHPESVTFIHYIWHCGSVEGAGMASFISASTTFN